MNDWIAECKECSWIASVDGLLSRADQRAELHTIKTGHATTVRRAA